ncbi:MAG: 16S rRNA (cytosine(1402)-N(4))-methyltransferase RsmH [Alistipes sp.]|jgi:16S rRNA (cytosine1402-N4)-methyltransferase|nr:16S rRNA (cytosine(1402)-N(4))-methyltransferase RsmH [Alistipes sp.]
MECYHIPVLLAESLELLDIQPDGTYVDLTFGGGGHSAAILDRLSTRGRLYGFDQDSEARGNAPDDPRFRFVEGNFRFMRGLLRAAGVTQVDGVLADLGVSSHHFDATERGFSFRGDAPLDMRMNRGRKLTAAHVVNTYEPARLIAILRDYGELEGPHRIAGRIVEARRSAPIQTTFELIETVRPLVPKSDENRWLSKLFQALRIEVNGEMEALRMALEQSLRVLRPEGRLVVISYHSLEDRLVKNFMKTGNFEGEVRKDFYGRAETPFKLVTRKAMAPTADEVTQNPRSRSAKLRAAAKWSE